MFVDLGEEFRVDDHNGETCKEVLIEHVNNETGDVHTLEEAKHDFEDDDFVVFSEVKGMVELNSMEPAKIKVTSQFCLHSAT
jgi:ubiquitin-activating enzyme E1